MIHHVLTNVSLPEQVRSLLGEECQVYVWRPDDPALGPILGTIEGIYAYGHMRVDEALIGRLPKLKVISNIGAGVDHIDLNVARRRGVPVGNTPDPLAGAVADMTFALILATARNVIAGANYARSPAFTHYDPHFLVGNDVHGTTLGIIGLGNVGRQVARRASGFDMTVLYHNRAPNRQVEAELGVSYASLPDLLSQSDFVTLHVPLTEETRGMIGRAELAWMKPTATFVNMGRGAVVDHEALLGALGNGRIAKAALDVTDPEPLPRDHPLLKMENVIIMPHLGSATTQTRIAMLQMSVDNLKAGLEGRPLLRRVV